MPSATYDEPYIRNYRHPDDKQRCVFIRVAVRQTQPLDVAESEGRVCKWSR